MSETHTIPLRSAPDELLTREELAGEMKCSIRTIDRMKAGGMPHVKWGRRLVRFRLRDAMAWREEVGDGDW